MQVFWCKGYKATSLEDLSGAMNLRAGSIYNTFTDKHTLYLEALYHYLETESRCLFGVLDEPISGLMAIRTLFDDLIEREVNDPQQRSCFMLNATLELAAHDPAVARLAEMSRTMGQLGFRQALARAQAAGEIGSHHDLDQLAAFLVSTVYGVRMMAKSGADRRALNRVVDAALSILV